MPWRGPKYEGEFPTLGWSILEWMAEFLPSPMDEDAPFIATDEQARFILDWFALDPDTCEYVYRRAAIEMAKGWGKSPLVAALALAEFAGPVVPDGWDADGEPVGKPWGADTPPPHVQIAAVSEDQTENTYGAIYQLLTAREHKIAANLGIDEGRTRLYLRSRPGARLEPVTASAGSREGQRLTGAVLDETHLWLPRNGGIKLARTIRRNLGKMGGRSIETTNAPELGEGSVAEKTGADADAGEPGILFYARRAPTEPDPSWSDEQLAAALEEPYRGADWIDRKRIVQEVRDPQTGWTDALRFFFNRRVHGQGRAVDPRRWDELAKPREIKPGTFIGVGFDGSISQDATVLIGCTDDGYSFMIDRWVRPAGAKDWTVPRTEVHEAVARAFDTYKIGLMLCDPPRWWTEIEEWARLYGEERVLAFDTNQPRRFAPAVGRWLTAIREGTHTHDGDPLTAQHVRAAHLRKVGQDPDDDGRTRYVLVKGADLGMRIDAAVADVLAYEAAMTMPEPPEALTPFFART